MMDMLNFLTGPRLPTQPRSLRNILANLLAPSSDLIFSDVQIRTLENGNKKGAARLLGRRKEFLPFIYMLPR